MTAESPDAALPAWRRFVPALAALLLTLAAALLEGWQATDLVWGMWISSLAIGYAVILTAIGAGLVRGRNLLARDPGEAGESRAPLPLLIVGGLFLFGFFSVHFLMFHFGHAVFTFGFFPLPGVPEPGSPGDLPVLAGEALALYWPVVLASLVARRDGFVAAITGNPMKAIVLPYHYVVKNHLMIFLVAGMNALGLSAWLLYALFAWYFFPFDLLAKRARAASPTAG